MATPQNTNIVWCWNNERQWSKVLDRISDNIPSITSMDMMITGFTREQDIKTRQVSELFTTYEREIPEELRIDMTKFIKFVLPWMQSVVLNLPKIIKCDKLLYPTEHTNISLSRLECLALSIGAWFCLFEYNYVPRNGQNAPKLEDFPRFSFTNIFAKQNLFGLCALLNYFDYTYDLFFAGKEPGTKYTRLTDRKHPLMQKIIIARQQAHYIEPMSMSTKLGETMIGDYQTGGLDSSGAPAHVVFCNRYIGDNFCTSNVTQQDISLLVRPELLVTMLFCAKLGDMESVVVYGAEKISAWTGIGCSARYKGRCDEKLTVGGAGGVRVAQIANIFIDTSKDTDMHSQMLRNFQRDLNKAICGFGSVYPRGCTIATSNWSHGHYIASMQVKFIQQLIAATVTGHTLEYYPTGRADDDQIVPFIEWYLDNEITVDFLLAQYNKLMKLNTRGNKSRLGELDIFECIMDGV